jgi:hypothetical protein
VPHSGAKELSRIVDKSILDISATPSPLLKYYHQLEKEMGVEIFKREILQLDQKVFKEYVNRLVNAQNHHLKVTKNAALRESNILMKEQF